jgi:hypothetical protein
MFGLIWFSGFRGEDLNVIFYQIMPNLHNPYICRDGPWVGPSQNDVCQRRPLSKMAAITKNRNVFKWPKLLYFKPGSAQI